MLISTVSPTTPHPHPPLVSSPEMFDPSSIYHEATSILAVRWRKETVNLSVQDANCLLFSESMNNISVALKLCPSF